MSSLTVTFYVYFIFQELLNVIIKTVKKQGGNHINMYVKTVINREGQVSFLN